MTRHQNTTQGLKGSSRVTAEQHALQGCASPRRSRGQDNLQHGVPGPRDARGAPPYCSEQGVAVSSILCTFDGTTPTQLLTEPKLGPLELSHHLKQCGKAHASRIYGGQVPEKHPSYTIIFFLDSENDRCFNSFIHTPNSKRKGCHTMGLDVNAVQRIRRPL